MNYSVACCGVVHLDVALAIAGHGYRVVPQYQFADKRIDLVVQGKKAQLAVECDGDFWHGADEYAADMERQRKLERSGWHFFRIRESRYYAEPEQVLKSLWRVLDDMGIMPVQQSEGSDEEETGQETRSDHENGESSFSDEGGNDNNAEEDDTGENSHFPLNDGPEGIDEALRARQYVIAKAIIEILQGRPNTSCMRDKMPACILSRWNIRTRGLPWQRFAKKVDDVIAVMARKGYITIYKSKNVRIKLGWERYPGISENRLR